MAQGPRSPAPRQCLERLPPMAGFQLSIYGRFWVSTEGVRDRFGLATAREPRRWGLFKSVNDRQPAVSGCGDSQERREPSTESASRENVESSGTGRVRGLSQKPSGHQGFERSLDLWKVIPDVFGQALALEEGLGMSLEEQKQIEIARVPQAPDTVEQIPDLLGLHPLWRLSEAVSILALSREGKRARKSRPVGKRSNSCPSPLRAARLPSSTSFSAATEGLSPSAQTRDRPG